MGNLKTYNPHIAQKMIERIHLILDTRTLHRIKLHFMC